MRLVDHGKANPASHRQLAKKTPEFRDGGVLWTKDGVLLQP
jgi:hypothetical protein